MSEYLADTDNKPYFKRKHKYYTCECGAELKVTQAIKTDWYGTLEYMRCKYCGVVMVAQNNIFLGQSA